MPRIAVPLVRPGDIITAELWNTMQAANRQCRIIDGVGTRVSEVADGAIIDFDPGSGYFAHPWLVSLRSATSAVIRPATINNVEPTIAGVKLSRAEAPVLTWEQTKLDAEGNGYIAAEITMNPETRQIATIEMVQVADPDAEQGTAPLAGALPTPGGAAASLSGGRARWPIARLRQREDETLAVFQITYFNLSHRAKYDPEGKPVRHFFFPA